MKLTDILNEDKYTIIDPKGNPAGTGTKDQANQRQKKLGGSKKGYFVVPAKSALKARRTLEKFRFDFKNPKLQDKMSDLYFEGVGESVNEGNVKLPSSAKKFWNTPVEKLIKTYGSDLRDTIPPSQWNTHPEIIDGYGQNAGPDIFKQLVRDNLMSNDRLDPKLAKMIGIPTNVSIIDYLNDGGSGLNGNKYFKKYGSWFSALYDIYEEMEKKFGKMKPQSVGESVNEDNWNNLMKIMQNKYDRQGYSLKELYDECINFLGKQNGKLAFYEFMKKNKSNKKVQDEFNKTSFYESVNEGYSTEEKRIVMMAVRKLAKYRNVPLDYAITDLLGAGQELERDIKKGKIK